MLFELKIIKDRLGGLPEAAFLEEVKKKGAELGANVLVFQCGGAGTVAETRCIVHGFFEATPASVPSGQLVPVASSTAEQQ